MSLKDILVLLGKISENFNILVLVSSRTKDKSKDTDVEG